MSDIQQDGIILHQDITLVEGSSNTYTAIAKFKQKGWFRSDSDLSEVRAVITKSPKETANIKVTVEIEEGHIYYPDGAKWNKILEGLNWDDYTDFSGRINGSKLIREFFRTIAKDFINKKYE